MTDFHPDHLRTPDNLCETDPRNQLFATFNQQEKHTKKIDDHYDSIKIIRLNHRVPEDIIIQFETSKNLLLYAWLVYRFYPVARLHALTVLEMALKERFEREIPVDDKNYRYGKDRRLMLSSLLRYCKDNNILKNEMFEVARHKAKMNAENRQTIENTQLIDDLGVSEMSFNDSDIEIQKVDWDFDYVEILKDTLPKLRNIHAHGSTMLDKSGLGILCTVSEIINQLWPETTTDSS
ncbi:MAG: hypothetical protein KME65_04645 [Candidatus Thiodiazotropha sp. (ex Ctena orbiculata)]|uniref:Uncharacterized protein n=1 Tax=Candidatus Thiodiazotropha taylori TaxID=2792791 RepID=A0A944MBY3_9GAMM|nr:hypothetical protein [Candidatus Thiodiazotropha taylori]MBV2136375.1 hypothetical protein [Candidatus Thiodiazotropha taylori]